jgi:hypothetical protein
MREGTSMEDSCQSLHFLSDWLARRVAGEHSPMDARATVLHDALTQTERYLRQPPSPARDARDACLSTVRSWMDATVALKTTDRRAAAECYEVAMDMAQSLDLGPQEMAALNEKWCHALAARAAILCSSSWAAHDRAPLREMRRYGAHDR